MGISALLHQVPVKVTGRALYDIPGLTSCCALDRFWTEPSPVDSELFHRLQTCLFDQTQINGSFFTRLDLTCANVLARYQQRYGITTARTPSDRTPERTARVMDTEPA